MCPDTDTQPSQEPRHEGDGKQSGHNNEKTKYPISNQNPGYAKEKGQRPRPEQIRPDAQESGEGAGDGDVAP